MNNFRSLYENGSFALTPARDGIYNSVLAANVPELVTVPAGVNFVVFSPSEDFWISYVFKATRDSSDDVVPAELSNLVTNGAFASDTSWTKGTGWTIAAGVASSDGTQTGNSDLEQNPSRIVQNQLYYVTFTVSNYSAGNIRPVIGGTTGTNRAANGTYSEYILAGSSAPIALRADLDFIGSVDNFSAVPAAYIPTADITTGRASELNPVVRDLTSVSAFSLVSAAAAKISMCFYT